jgi:hypothetical protein
MVGIATFVKHNPDWEVRIHGTPAHIREHGLQYGQEADWTWWWKLYHFGGFQFATDIVFLKPIPEEWLEEDLSACFNGGMHVYHNAAFGSVQGTEFVAECLNECRRLLTDKARADYQAFGPTLLRRMNYTGRVFHVIPMDALCPVTSLHAYRYWREEPITLPDECVGAHWYGGYKTAKEGLAGPDSSFAVCQVAREALQ